MKQNVRNKDYGIQEAVAYYILGYKKYENNKEKNGLEGILKNILEIAKENINTKEIVGVDEILLKRIHFSWTLSADDFASYATCVFYVLINRESKITEEKIVKEFLTEIHSHHPRRTMQEAEIILDNLISQNHNL